MLQGEVQGARGDAVREDRVDQVGEGELPLAALVGVLAGERQDHLGQRGAVTAQQPEDAGVAASAEGGGQGIAIVSGRFPGRGLGRHRGQVADFAAGLRFLAGGQRFAGGEAGTLGHLGRDPGRVRLDGAALQGHPDGRRGGPLAAQHRRRLAGLGVDRVDLQQPGLCGSLDLLARPRAGAAGAEPCLGVVLRPPHGSWIGRGRGGLSGHLVLVVGALGRSMGLLGGRRLGPGARRELAALVREPARLGTGSGRGWARVRGRRWVLRRRRRRRGGGHVVGAAGRRVKQRRGRRGSRIAGRAGRGGRANRRQRRIRPAGDGQRASQLGPALADPLGADQGRDGLIGEDRR